MRRRNAGPARSREGAIRQAQELLREPGSHAISVVQDFLEQEGLTLYEISYIDFGPQQTQRSTLIKGRFWIDGMNTGDREFKQVLWTITPLPDGQFRVDWRIDISRDRIHLSPMPWSTDKRNNAQYGATYYHDTFADEETALYRAVEFAWSCVKVIKDLGDRASDDDGTVFLDVLNDMSADEHPFAYDRPPTAPALYTGHILDSYQLRDNPRPNAPTQVDDVIQVAMDIAEEQRPHWWRKATKALHEIAGAGFLDRANQDRFVVAQCIRELEPPSSTIRQWLYRIWGKSRLNDVYVREPYIIVSYSTQVHARGELAIFRATADSTEVAEDAYGHVWPLGVDGLTGFLDERASWTDVGGNAQLAVHERLTEIGCTHIVPCDAQLALAENPARGGAMAKQNDDPGVSPRALRMFRGFHKRDWRKAGDFSPDLVIPDRVTLLGDAKFVLYKSDKLNPETEADEGWIDYIHEHGRGVKVCRADASGRKVGDIAVPAWLQKQTELVWLGDCNGFAYWDADGTERDIKGSKPYPELYTVPSGKALLVIQNKRTLLAMFWGGRLGVEPRGIVH